MIRVIIAEMTYLCYAPCGACPTWTVNPEDPDVDRFPSGKFRKAIIKKAKKAMKIGEVKAGTIVTADLITNMYNSWKIHSLGTLSGVSTVATMAPSVMWGMKPPEEKTMSYDIYDDCDCCENNSGLASEGDKREYLNVRLLNIYRKKNLDNRKAFAMDDEDAPETATELVDRIKNGKYTLLSEEEQKRMSNWGYGWQKSILWRAPDSKPDEVGYKAADKEIEAAYTLVRDSVRVLPVEQAVKDVQAFATS